MLPGKRKGVFATGEADVHVLVISPMAVLLESVWHVKVLTANRGLIILPSSFSSTPKGLQRAGLPSIAKATDMESSACARAAPASIIISIADFQKAIRTPRLYAKSPNFRHGRHHPKAHVIVCKARVPRRSGM